jgi:Putative transposase
LTEAAYGSLKPPPTRRLRRAHLHLSYSTTLSRLPDTTISNHRLVSFVDGQVTFRWRDSADHNKQKLRTFSLDKFLRRFLLHLLPKGFVRIRNFGFLASRSRAKTLSLCFQLLGSRPESHTEQHSSSTSTAEDSPNLYRCPHCGGPMKIIERLTAEEILLRSPPLVTAA